MLLTLVKNIKQLWPSFEVDSQSGHHSGVFSHEIQLWMSTSKEGHNYIIVTYA